jgi:hypothetical protein
MENSSMIFDPPRNNAQWDAAVTAILAEKGHPPGSVVFFAKMRTRLWVATRGQERIVEIPRQCRAQEAADRIHGRLQAERMAGLMPAGRQLDRLPMG